ncbi:hypothetical protein TNCV_1201311 [Trichonephila clavipes]|nr:hypothetical protein TNCV_1201311 [Trichonephila clavipes]
MKPVSSANLMPSTSSSVSTVSTSSSTQAHLFSSPSAIIPRIQMCKTKFTRNRRKRPKVQKPEIEIKMVPHRPRKSAPTEYATDEEDMITYDVEEEELEQYPTDKLVIKEGPTNFPKGYLRALTPSRYRKNRN